MMGQVDENGFGEIVQDASAPDPIIPTRAGPGGWQRPEQSLGLALLVGALTGVIGSVSWAMVSLASERRVGYLALGIGFVVGWVVRRVGRGTSWPFGMVAALSTFTSCALGMVLALALRAALAEGSSFGVDALGRLVSFLLTQPLLGTLVSAINPIDGVFTLVATYQAFQIGYARPSNEAPEVLP